MEFPLKNVFADLNFKTEILLFEYVNFLLYGIPVDQPIAQAQVTSVMKLKSFLPNLINK